VLGAAIYRLIGSEDKQVVASDAVALSAA
jgi:hypothetical protein